MFISNISIYASKKNELNIDNIKRIWSCLIKNKISNYEQSVFLTWLLKEKMEKDLKNSNKKNYFLSDSIIYDVFNKIFIDPIFVDITTMTFDVFKCFQAFFEYINLQEKTIELNHKNQIRVLKFNNILGKDYIWFVLANNPHEQVLKRLI